MRPFISELTRNTVALRANFCSEYCKFHEKDLVFTFQVDHIISLKHGGNSDLTNLAYACSYCNQNKGTDLATYIDGSNKLIRLFNPRTDIWSDHFNYSDGNLLGITKIGLATIKLLDINNIDRVILRKALAEIGRFSNFN